MKIRVKGILFDMDGVLVSSIGSVERSWAKWSVLHGLDPVETVKRAHGRRSIDSVRAIRPDLDADAENKKIEDWEVEDTEGVEAVAGVCNFIKRLPSGSWTIVTSATRRLAEVRLGAAGITPPEKWITSDMVMNGKPDPEPYRKGVELLGLAPEDCLVIEDAESGATAGKAAGCRVLGTTFSHSIEDLKAADWIVDSLEHVNVSHARQQGSNWNSSPSRALTNPIYAEQNLLHAGSFSSIFVSDLYLGQTIAAAGSPRPPPVFLGVHADRVELRRLDINIDPGLQKTKLLQPLRRLQRARRQGRKAIQRGLSVSIQPKVLLVFHRSKLVAIKGNRRSRKIQRPPIGGSDNFDRIGILNLLRSTSRRHRRNQNILHALGIGRNSASICSGRTSGSSPCTLT